MAAKTLTSAQSTGPRNSAAAVARGGTHERGGTYERGGNTHARGGRGFVVARMSATATLTLRRYTRRRGTARTRDEARYLTKPARDEYSKFECHRSSPS